MQERMRILSYALVALIVMALTVSVVACGGSSGDDTEDDSAQNAQDGDNGSYDSVLADDGDAIEPVDYVANAQAVLSQSVTEFSAAEVTSLQGDVVFDFTMAGTAVSGDAEFAYDALTGMYMAMTFEGGDSQSLIDLSQLGTLEVLVRDGGAYLNLALLGGWISLAPEDMAAFGGDSVANVVANGSMFDYAAFMTDVEGVEYVGQEDINGTATVHYSLTGNLQDLIASFSDALGTTGDNAISDQVLGSELDGPVAVNVWIGESDGLPYRVAAAGDIALPDGTSMVMNVTANFFGYNAAVSLPPVPETAMSFADVMGLFGGQPPAAPTP